MIKTIRSFGGTFRLTSHIFLLLIIISTLWAFIVYINTFRTSSDKPSLINNINITKYKSSNYYQQSRDDKQNQILLLTHQPSSNSSVLRALLVFYPNNQNDIYEPEFRWLYLSWIEMMMNESTLWRTDLIVYVSDYASIFEELGCVYDEIRIDAEEKPKCRVFPYVRIKDRTSTYAPESKYQIIDKQRSQSLYEHLRDYGYIDSINTLFEYNSSYFMYDFILRTDMDCFLTKNFALYVPYNNSLIVGYGGYSTTFNSNRLRHIATNMQWKYADRNSLGSTWYGPPSIAHRIAKFTIQAMLHLAINEFTKPERQEKLSTILWPEWYYGVLSLYGGHLAINHLITSEKIEIRIADQLLDQGITSKDITDISKNHRLHLHCRNGSNPLSQCPITYKKYNHVKPSTLPTDTSPYGYAMRLVFESNSLSLKELKQKLLDVKK